VLFTAIFLGWLVAVWLFCAFVPWVALSVATRGNAGLINLPLCLFAGVVGAVAVPLLGMTDATGLWLSFAVAAVVPALLLAVRRFSMKSAGSNTSRSKVVEEAQPK
jgi:FtsH-binding integral membrane protein